MYILLQLLKILLVMKNTEFLIIRLPNQSAYAIAIQDKNSQQLYLFTSYCLWGSQTLEWLFSPLVCIYVESRLQNPSFYKVPRSFVTYLINLLKTFYKIVWFIRILDQVRRFWKRLRLKNIHTANVDKNIANCSSLIPQTACFNVSVYAFTRRDTYVDTLTYIQVLKSLLNIILCGCSNTALEKRFLVILILNVVIAPHFADIIKLNAR